LYFTLFSVYFMMFSASFFITFMYDNDSVLHFCFGLWYQTGYRLQFG
jgi:hypothetical protein